jgi:hypothetical protein
MGFIPTQQLWINLWKLWIAIGNYSRCPWIAGRAGSEAFKEAPKALPRPASSPGRVLLPRSSAGRFRGPHRRRG